MENVMICINFKEMPYCKKIFIPSKNFFSKLIVYTINTTTFVSIYETGRRNKANQEVLLRTAEDDREYHVYRQLAAFK